MKHIVSIYVHEKSKNSYCGSDFSGYKVFSSSENALKFIRSQGYTLSELAKDTKLGISIYYLSGIAYNSSRKFIEKIFEHGKFPCYEEYWKNKNKIYYEDRRRKGHVVCKSNDDMTPEDYKGNLKNSLTNNVLEYISSSIVCGYLGHSQRLHKHDTFIEDVFNNLTIKVDSCEVDKWDILGTWFTSSSSRHFMDNTEDEDMEYFKKIFIEALEDSIIKGHIYALPEHKGTYKSTQELYSNFENRITIEYTK